MESLLIYNEYKLIDDLTNIETKNFDELIIDYDDLSNLKNAEDIKFNTILLVSEHLENDVKDKYKKYITYTIINNDKYININNIVKLIYTINFNLEIFFLKEEHIYIKLFDNANIRLYDINGNYVQNQNYLDINYYKKFINTTIDIDLNDINMLTFDDCIYNDNPWAGNFHIHYMECFPALLMLKLLHYQNKKYYFIIREKYYEQYLELFKLFEIETNYIIINNNRNIVYVKNCIITKLPLNGYYRYNKNPLVKIMSLYIKHYFEMKYTQLNYKYNKNIIFIKRKLLGELNSGKNRYISNFNDVSELLKTYNVNVYEFENLSFEDKFKILSGTTLILMEIGASIVNLYYSLVENSKIILFSNNVNYKLHSLFKDDIQNINNITNYEIIPCLTTENHPIKPEYINTSYIIDIELLENIIKKIN